MIGINAGLGEGGGCHSEGGPMGTESLEGAASVSTQRSVCVCVGGGGNERYQPSTSVEHFTPRKGDCHTAQPEATGRCSAQKSVSSGARSARA